MLHVDPKILHGPAAHVFKFKMLMVLRRVIADRTDQTRFAGPLQREYPEEVRVIDVDVQLAIHGGSAGLDIRNVE